MMSSHDSQYELVYLEPYKRLMKHIAQAWLNGDELQGKDPQERLLKKVLPDEEANFFKIVALSSPEAQEPVVFMDLRERTISVCFEKPKSLLVDGKPMNLDHSKPGSEEIQYFKGQLEEFIKDDSSQPPWAFPWAKLPIETVAFAAGEEKRFSVLKHAKRLSQLVNQSWLDGQELLIDKNFFIDNGLLAKDEEDPKTGKHTDTYYAQVRVVEIPEGSPPYFGKAIIESDGSLVLEIPYSKEPPSDLQEEDLRAWVENDDPDVFVPPPVCLIATSS